MHEIPELDRKGLRQFGLIFAGIIGLVFGILLPWVWRWNFPVWPWIVAAAFILWALLAPASIRPFYRLWMQVGLVINWVMTRVLLGTVFFAVIMPMGIVMRLRKWDPMARRFDPHRSSYRVPSKPAPDKNMEKPF